MKNPLYHSYDYSRSVPNQAGNSLIGQQARNLLSNVPFGTMEANNAAPYNPAVHNTNQLATQDSLDVLKNQVNSKDASPSNQQNAQVPTGNEKYRLS